MKPIEINLGRTQITQSIMDHVWTAITKEADKAETVDVVIRNVPTRDLPRFIVDSGQIYEALCHLLSERP